MRILTFLFILTSFHSLGQVAISGKVLSDSTGAPLEGASVYINNSTLGAVTAADGSFRIDAVKPGNYELVVSFVSYDNIVHPITVSEKDLRFEFRLVGGARSMRGIYIMSEEKRKHYLGLFRSQFLGLSYRADRCEILNEEDIYFGEGETADQVIAYADTPLVILNKLLGYKITFNLEDFYYNRRTLRSSFLGYARYEEIEGVPNHRYDKNRKEAYEGSSMHFFRSWYKGKAAENDFVIYRMIPVNKNMVKDAAPSPEDIFLVKDVGGVPFALDWNGTIAVVYRKDPAGKSFLERKWPMNNPTRGVESQLEMLKPPARLAANGMLKDPLSIRYSGYWSQEKLGDMLPVDYYPSN